MPSVLTLFLEWIPSSRTWTIFRNWLINPFKSLCIWFKRFVFHCSFLLIFLLFNITNFLLQICIIEGTRNGIERCLELIQERLPTHMYPDFTIKQINEPTAADLLQSQARQGLSVTLPPGQLTGATITAIVSTAHIFLQLPDSLTFHHLRRLQHCMRCTYERLSDSLPKVPKEAVETGLVCVMKAEDRYYRLQVVNYDISSDCCEVKFLDFGGYETVDVSDLLQIRQDFMNLPFQVIINVSLFFWNLLRRSGILALNLMRKVFWLNVMSELVLEFVFLKLPPIVANFC